MHNCRRKLWHLIFFTILMYLLDTTGIYESNKHNLLWDELNVFVYCCHRNLLYLIFLMILKFLMDTRCFYENNKHYYETS